MNILKLIDELSVDEGRKARIYVDTVGKITGGVGRNLSDRPFFEDEIDLMLKNDIKLVEADLDANLPWWRKMSDARQRALSNLCFNLGITRLLLFKNSLILLKAGKWDEAAAAFMSSKWATQVGNRAIRVTNMIRKG
jgi:lysozyme